jgi:hypothetical protein
MDALAFSLDLNTLMDPIPGVRAVRGTVDTHPGHALQALERQTAKEELPVPFPEDAAAVPDAAASLLEAAERVAGLPLDVLGHDAGDGGSTRRAKLLAGLLWNASVSLVDDLFADIFVLSVEDIPAAEADGTYVLGYLPQRFAHRYDAGFARRFLTVCSDLSTRLAYGWKNPSCVAQELAVRCLLEHAGLLAEGLLVEADLPGDWRGMLEDALLEDGGTALLYDPALDGFEDDPLSGPPGMASMKFEDWFRPFSPDRQVPPYAQGY